jgi:hypothetical protein
VDEADRPAVPPCPLAYTRSEPFAVTCEYFRGGSRLNYPGFMDDTGTEPWLLPAE